MIALGLLALSVMLAAIRPRPRHRRAVPFTTPTHAHRVAFASAWIQRRDRHRCPSALGVAAWFDDIARRVRSGSTLREAVAVIPADTPTERATAAFRLAIDRGLSISESVARVGDSGPHLRLALGVLDTTSRIGGPSAASIDRTAALLRQRSADLDERSSLAAQARLSTHVMTAVPVLMLAVLVTTDHDVRAAVSSPVGSTCIAAGLVMNIVGWWWMRRIVGAAP